MCPSFVPFSRNAVEVDLLQHFYHHAVYKYFKTWTICQPENYDTHGLMLNFDAFMRWHLFYLIQTFLRLSTKTRGT